MQSRNQIIVLGGGIGGVVAAVELRRRLPDRQRVILVDRREHHLFPPSLLWLMIGKRGAEKITRPLELLSRRGVEVIRGEIEQIDPERRRVALDGRTLKGDHVIVSLGAEHAPEGIPGLAEAGYDLYSLSGAEALKKALAEFRSGRLVLLTATPAYKCPAAPYEAAMLIDDDYRKRKLRGDVAIDLYAAEPGPMGVAGPAVSQAVRRLVEQKGIGYRPEHAIQEVDPGRRRLAFANGASAGFDLLAYVPPHRPPRVVVDAELTGESGWVPVNRSTLETRFPGVYAIGDVTGIPLALGKPLPKAGVFAHRQAEVVARNIARAITGKGEPAAFDGHGECFIETGEGKAGFGRGNFYAEPVPDVKLHPVGRLWHWGKILYEKRWLHRWF